MGAMRAVFNRRLGAGAGDWTDLAQQASERYGVDPALILATIQTESGGNPQAVNPRDPSYGLGSVKLETARWILSRPDLQADDLLDPWTNIQATAAYLAYQLQRYGGDVSQAVSAYNAGTATAGNPGYVERVLGSVAAFSASVGGTVGPAAEAASGAILGPETGQQIGSLARSYWWIGAGLILFWLWRR